MSTIHQSQSGYRRCRWEFSAQAWVPVPGKGSKLMNHRRSQRLLAISAAAALLTGTLAACGAGKKTATGPTGGTQGSGAGKSITIGTTDQVVALDPAGFYDFGSTTLEI